MRKKPQYLVKQLGYLLHYAIQELLENLANADKKVKEFELMKISNLKKGECNKLLTHALTLGHIRPKVLNSNSIPL